jgi:hypothetical protein
LLFLEPSPLISLKGASATILLRSSLSSMLVVLDKPSPVDPGPPATPARHPVVMIKSSTIRLATDSTISVPI